MNNIDAIQWIELPSNKDSRGILTSIESGRDVPFEIKRIFYMHRIVAERGGHAHTDTDQVIVPISGSFDVEISNGTKIKVFHMDDATKGLYIPRMFFVRLFDFTDKDVCLVLASTHYDMSKSIRTWEEYLTEINE